MSERSERTTGPGVPRYTEFFPQLYQSPISTFWWLRRRSYLTFVLRELSSVFVAWSVVYMLLFINAVRQGDQRYQEFLDWSASPWLLVINLVTLLFVVFHAITWFNLTPQAMVVRLRGRRVPRSLIAASVYLGWLVVSAFVVWLLVGA
jgi:fumarate reductase subunit C